MSLVVTGRKRCLIEKTHPRRSKHPTQQWHDDYACLEAQTSSQTDPPLRFGASNVKPLKSNAGTRFEGLRKLPKPVSRERETDLCGKGVKKSKRTRRLSGRTPEFWFLVWVTGLCDCARAHNRVQSTHQLHCSEAEIQSLLEYVFFGWGRSNRWQDKDGSGKPGALHMFRVGTRSGEQLLAALCFAGWRLCMSSERGPKCVAVAIWCRWYS